MKKFKIGDRVKLKYTSATGMIVSCEQYHPVARYKINCDCGDFIYATPENMTRLRKKKKESAANITTLWSIGSNHGAFITKEQLANAWDKYIWMGPVSTVSNAAESKIFEKICKELGL